MGQKLQIDPLIPKINMFARCAWCFKLGEDEPSGVMDGIYTLFGRQCTSTSSNI